MNFPQNIAKADVTLTNAANVDVRGNNRSISVNARNVELTAGEFGISQLRAGITADTISVDARSGYIAINATENITVDDSLVVNRIDLEAIGNAGNITVFAGNLNLTNGGQVNVATSGEGNAGSINIIASETITIDGAGIEDNGFQGVLSQVGELKLQKRE